MQGQKQAIKQILVKSHAFYSDRYYKKLNETSSSIVKPMTGLCGGWYLQTFKQVANKLSKNKSSPLPLFFPNIQAMEPISKNKQLLRSVFKTFDTRGIGKIDACEFYSICLALSKGSYQTYLKTVVDIFGFENNGRINKNEFFFFLDSFYRALPKVLIAKGYEKPHTDMNLRLDFKDINKFLEILFDEEKTDIQRNEIYEALMKVAELNEFMKYIQKKCMGSAQNSRINAIQKMKLQTQVRQCVYDMVSKIQEALK